MTSEFAIAVHALVFLNHKKTVVSSEVLAENICTNPTRVRKIMARLKKAGLVETKEGVVGGYQTARDAADIKLRMVSDALEAKFVSASWKSGDLHMECMIASGMAGIMDDIYGKLNETCRNEMDKITIADLDNKIFS